MHDRSITHLRYLAEEGLVVTLAFDNSMRVFNAVQCTVKSTVVNDTGGPFTGMEHDPIRSQVIIHTAPECHKGSPPPDSQPHGRGGVEGVWMGFEMGAWVGRVGTSCHYVLPVAERGSRGKIGRVGRGGGTGGGEALIWQGERVDSNLPSCAAVAEYLCRWKRGRVGGRGLVLQRGVGWHCFSLYAWCCHSCRMHTASAHLTPFNPFQVLLTAYLQWTNPPCPVHPPPAAAAFP